MKLEIKDPCGEDWNKMKIGMNSRHCEVCVKSVVDFTTMNRAEIITYILSNPNESVCGRMRPDQFDFRHEDIPVLVEVLKTRPRNHAFLILTLVCLSLSACAQNEPISPNQTEIQPILLGKMAPVEVDTTQTQMPPPPPEELLKSGEVSIECTPEVLQGDVIVVPEPETDPKRALQFAEKMPEYPNGMEALFEYVNDYFAPKKVTEKGSIYARFVVKKDGTLTDIELLRVPDNLAYLKPEVIRMVRSMPKWIPGENDGKPVDVYYTIPVRFQ